MKIKYFLLLLLSGLVSSLLSMAQTSPYRSCFGNEFTRWYTFYEYFDFGGTELLKVENKDTILSNGIKYKQAILAGDNWDEFGFGIREEIETGALFINVDGAAEIQVSRMDLEIGDKFYFPSTINIHENHDYYFEGILSDESGEYAVVDSVYYKDGRKHIRFEAHYFAFTYEIPLTFIEGIGPNISFNLFTGGPWYTVCFLCYETENELWRNKDIKDRYTKEPVLTIYDGECLFRFSSISAVKDDFPFKLIQQKGKIEILLNGANLKQGAASIYSIDGKQLVSKTFRNSSQVDFSVSEFFRGVYVIFIKDNETGRVWSSKFIIKE